MNTTETAQIVIVAFLSLVGCVSIGYSASAWFIGRRETEATTRRQAYAAYCGRQEGFGGADGFTLWNLTDHRLGMKGSTVDEHWLDDAITAHEQNRVAPKALRLHGAYWRDVRMIGENAHVRAARTVAGERWIHGRKCQVHVIVTADRHEFFDPVNAGPDAP